MGKRTQAEIEYIVEKKSKSAELFRGGAEQFEQFEQAK